MVLRSQKEQTLADMFRWEFIQSLRVAPMVLCLESTIIAIQDPINSVFMFISPSHPYSKEVVVLRFGWGSFGWSLGEKLIP